eukprot:766993-Hanusia_phi.AAC.3
MPSGGPSPASTGSTCRRTLWPRPGSARASAGTRFPSASAPLAAAARASAAAPQTSLRCSPRRSRVCSPPPAPRATSLSTESRRGSAPC